MRRLGTLFSAKIAVTIVGVLALFDTAFAANCEGIFDRCSEAECEEARDGNSQKQCCISQSQDTFCTGGYELINVEGGKKCYSCNRMGSDDKGNFCLSGQECEPYEGYYYQLKPSGASCIGGVEGSGSIAMSDCENINTAKTVYLSCNKGYYLSNGLCKNCPTKTDKNGNDVPGQSGDGNKGGITSCYMPEYDPVADLKYEFGDAKGTYRFTEDCNYSVYHYSN